MAENLNPTRKLTLTEVPDDVWAVAQFAIDAENNKKGTISPYELEEVVWHLPKSAGGHYVMIIRVIGDVPSNMFGVVVHKVAETGRMALEQLNPIIRPMAYN